MPTKKRTTARTPKRAAPRVSPQPRDEEPMSNDLSQYITTKQAADIFGVDDSMIRCKGKTALWHTANPSARMNGRE